VTARAPDAGAVRGAERDTVAPGGAGAAAPGRVAPARRPESITT
jgi:hypothetical protein